MEETQQRKETVAPSAFNSASWISKSYGWWMTPLVWKIYRKKDTRLQDIPEVPKEIEAKTLENRLNQHARLTGDESRIQLAKFFLKTLYRLAPQDVIALIITTSISCGCFVMQSYLIDGLLRAFLSGSAKSMYIYGGCISAATMLAATFYYSRLFYSEQLGIKLRAAYSSALFTKVLNMSEYDMSGINTGKIISLISVDASLLLNGSINLFGLVEFPVAGILSFIMCWWLIGWITLIGLSLMVIQTVSQLWLGKYFGKLRERATVHTDAKMVLINDILNGIKVIKMHAWELLFQEEVHKTRRREYAFLGRSIILRAVVVAVYYLLSRIAIFVVILACYFFYNDFPRTQAFSLLALMNIWKVTFGYVLPTLFETGAECLVSLARIENFLTTKHTTLSKPLIIREQQNYAEGTVKFENVSCSWNNVIDKPAIQDLTFSAAKGQLIGIIGPVGSGKTTILKTILGEIPTLSGDITIQGRVAYVPQDAFVFPSSIKQNITFGNPIDEKKIQKTIETCCLSEDIANFPRGLKQPVGEKGICLSGGQKARLNLARAVYDDADIYLLDDPFSAVDAKIGRQIFEKCISTFMKNKTCILVTNQDHFLQNASMIILLESGTSIAQGTYDEVRVVHGKIGTLFGSSKPHNKPTPNIMKDFLEDDIEDIEIEEDGILLPGSQVMVPEHRSKGHISATVYWTFLTIGSNVLPLMLFIIAGACTVAITVALESWLKIWVNAESEEYLRLQLLNQSFENATLTENATLVENMREGGLDRSYYLWVFSALMAATIICTLSAFHVIGRICCTASRGLHAALLQCVVRAKMAVFETQSIGNFLGRFSLDMSRIDTVLPYRCIDLTVDTLSSTGFTIMILMQSYWLALPCVIIASVIGFFFKIINKIVRDIKRIEGIARGPLYSHVANAIAGATVARAFHKKDLIIQEFQTLLNRHSSTLFIFNGINCWGCEAVNTTSSMYIICIVFTMILTRGAISTGETGLALISSIALTEVIFWICYQFTHVESEMTSVERVIAYSKLPLEAELKSLPNKKPPRDWPHRGHISFQDVSLSYTEHSDSILKELKFSIEPCEKIGIVGTTGAGKSSILTAIYRLHEPKGRILIDNLCINDIGLHDLRSILSIIPQDPILFCGTIRKNLDPCNIYNDEKLWYALGKVQMLEVIKMQPGCLDSNVSEGGINFSVGERQLLCLARALLRGNKILMMDEATANIDVRNDEIIQTTIKNHFKDTTVITIAHRLNNVMDLDKIMVVEKGKIVEFDKPQILLQNKDGALYKLVHQNEDSAAELMHLLSAQIA